MSRIEWFYESDVARWESLERIDKLGSAAREHLKAWRELKERRPDMISMERVQDVGAVNYFVGERRRDLHGEAMR